MRFQITFFILILAIILAGCSGGETPNTNTTNTNSANIAKSNSELVPERKQDAPTTNNAPTIKPVVDAYYDAIKKKDDAGLRKVLSQELTKRMEAEMKEEGKKSLAAFFAASEKLEPAVEVRNEKIEGDKATAELKGGMYVNWTPFVFIKENGEWKWTGDSPQFKNVSEGAK